jgi:hypothetical protein
VQVEGCEDQDVLRLHRPLFAFVVHDPPAEQLLDDGQDRVAFLVARLGAAVVRHGHPDDARLRGNQLGRRAAEHPVPHGLRDALEPAVVERVGDESAHVRVHSPGLSEEDAAVGQDGGVAVEQVLETG